MSVSLLYKDKVFEWNKNTVKQDCFDDYKLESLLNIMSKGDKQIYDCCTKVMLNSLLTSDEIYYRQEVMKDCINNQKLIQEIYDIAESAINDIILNSRYILINDFPSVVLNNSIDKLRDFLHKYILMKDKLSEKQKRFHSRGFIDFIKELQEKFNPTFIKMVDNVAKSLEKTDNIIMDASLGVGYRATNYTLCGSKGFSLATINNVLSYKVTINSTDTQSIGKLLDLKQKGLEETADILACVVDTMNDSFLELQKELAFYCGCINLYQNLQSIGCNVIFPVVFKPSERKLRFTELYDIGLALSQQKKVVGNSINLDQCDLIILTGANQGGKSTFLRSVGIAQIMFQAGMFVGAEEYESSICNDMYTHFRKDEDANMNSGKLDDELKRFSNIVDMLHDNTMLMCNESFSSTNEKEGTEIALPIIDALIESNVKVFIVTHFYSIPKYYQNKKEGNNIVILQPERKEDTSRSFKMVETKLSETSYALDLYNQLFPATGFEKEGDTHK